MKEETNIHKYRSEINRQIPVNRNYFGESVSFEHGLPLIDAAYVPTLGQRVNLVNCIEALRPHCGQIIILLSGSKPDWMSRIEFGNVKLIPDFSVHSRPDLNTHQSSENPSLLFLRTYDIPAKRNFALLHARANCFRYVGLVDDDMIFEETSLLTARYLLSQGHGQVGFYALDYPDIATIDHVERYITGQPARVSIGGNFLFFNLDMVSGFFPYLYNDDWVFIFINMHNGCEVVAGGTVGHLEHQPWLNDTRIEFEQFGDIVITGFKRRIGAQKPFLEMSRDFWSSVYDGYVSRLVCLRDSTSDERWQHALTTALKACQRFAASDLADFARLLAADMRRT